MVDFIRAGGWGMWMVLAFGGIAFVTAVIFAVKPDTRRLPMMRAMTWSTVFAMVGAVSSNLIAVCWHVPQNEEWMKNSERLIGVLLQGLGEALTPATAGGALLAIAWMLIAVGTRRLQDPDA